MKEQYNEQEMIRQAFGMPVCILIAFAGLIGILNNEYHKAVLLLIPVVLGIIVFALHFYHKDSVWWTKPTKEGSLNNQVLLLAFAFIMFLNFIR